MVNATCKAPQPLNESLMTPQGIQGWLRTVGSSVKTVQDFVCCLPEEYRSNYMVGHSSVAGQNGTPASPRVIMMNKFDGRKKKMRMLLSFNGGEASMLGGKSIEMAYINPKNKEAEYFDLEFNEVKGRHLSVKNPESCMNCHGLAGKVPPGGAKMIFDVFGDWHRFVGGVTVGPCNKEEDELRRIVEAQAVESVRKNPQYKCLDKSLLEKDAKGEYFKFSSPLAGIDNGINDLKDGPALHQRRKWAQSVLELDKYKHFMAASYFCGGKINDWMGPEIYRRNFANLEIDPRLKKDGPLEQVFKEALQDEDKKVLEFRKKQQITIANKNAEKRIMEINRSSRACLDRNKHNQYFQDYEKQLFQRARQESSKYYQNRDPLLLLEMDSYLRGPRLQSRSLPSVYARFALEGEGIGTYMIQKSFRPGELVHGGLNMDFGQKDPLLSELMDHFLGKKTKTPEKFKELCDEIKSVSKAQLSAGSEGPKLRSGSR